MDASTASTLIGLLGAAGLGSAVTQLVKWLTERKKTKVDGTVVLSKASSELVEQYVSTNQGLRAELAEVKDHLDKVEDKLDHVLDVVAQEKRYVRVNGYTDAPILKLIQPTGYTTTGD